MCLSTHAAWAKSVVTNEISNQCQNGDDKYINVTKMIINVIFDKRTHQKKNPHNILQVWHFLLDVDYPFFFHFQLIGSLRSRTIQ